MSDPVNTLVDHDLRCSNCGYNLRGLQDPRCPECGQTFDPDAPEENRSFRLSIVVVHSLLEALFLPLFALAALGIAEALGSCFFPYLGRGAALGISGAFVTAACLMIGLIMSLIPALSRSEVLVLGVFLSLLLAAEGTALCWAFRVGSFGIWVFIVIVVVTFVALPCALGELWGPALRRRRRRT